ncbi:MPN domain-containing protein-like isoform X2 [Homarus americanus]|uniref:MPN domain-containing protein-like isoform X2 n=1 Tax=Homarus americanus TaxID=6706 RepID=UPI001C466A64|nr:MPN domain-containing protein-like isoform X2 [Homarus americanus]
MSVEPPTHEEIQIDDEVEEIEEEEEDEEEVDEEEDVDEEEEEEEIEEVTHGRSTGRGLTLKTLVKEGILQPGEGLMTINYLGNKFKGDLLPDGRIRSQETNKIFGTPSAWAIYCKKIVNPDKKSGCGWASVRYRGKKLDSYKNNWFRQKQLEFEKEGEALDEEEMTDSDSDGPHEQEIVEFELIGNRHPNHDMNTMVELTSFQSLGRMQPFTVTMSSSAMAMIDIHAHLTTSEVVGYLAGQWDVTNHNLIVSHALPVRCRLGDGEKGRVVEQALYAEMEKLNLSLVGWYHSHPFSPPLPSLRDIDSQLEYELKMKGSNDASYTPCIGIIVSPYVRGGGQGTTATGFWVMPPPEHKPQEYGRPMSIQFTIVQDAFIPKDALIHVRDTVKFFKDCPDSVVFSDVFQDRFTYWDKLKTAIRMCVPKDHYAPLMDYLAKLLELKNYVPEPTVVSSKSKSSTSGPKPQTSAELTPIESSSTTTVPSSVIKNRTSIDTGSGVVHIDENITAEVLKSSQTTVSVSPENLMSESVSILKSQTQVQSMEVSMPEAVRSPHLDTQQGHCEPKQLRAQQEEYQPPSYQQHSPPAYKPPQQEHLYEEQKQESEVQQEFLREQDYDKHQHKQTPQQYQQQLQYSQQIDDYQGDQKCEEELQKEYREPPPSYHQQHFTIPTGYIHEEPKTSRPLEDRVPGSDAQQVEEGTQGTSHYHEKLALDPWGGHRQSEPPHQSDSREVEVIQPMDLDTQS